MHKITGTNKIIMTKFTLDSACPATVFKLLKNISDLNLTC